MEQNSIKAELKFQLKAHQGAVYCLEDGRTKGTFLTAGADRKVIEWDYISGEGKLLANSAATVFSLKYLKERELLLIGQAEGGLHIVDLLEGKEIKYLKDHQSYIFDIIHIPRKNEIILSSADGSFSVWSTETFEQLYKQQLGIKKLRKMSLSLDGGNLLISSGDNTTFLVNTKDYSLIGKYELGSSVNVSRFMNNGKQLLIGDKDAHLHLVDTATSKVQRSIPAHYWAIYDIAFSPDKRFFATASRDKIVKIWDAEKMQVLDRIEGRKRGGHTHSVNSILWPEEGILISSGDDADIRIWELKGL